MYRQWDDYRPGNVQTYTTTVTKQDQEEDQKVEDERSKLIVRGLSGLKNQGNTCYMNSIIQCISNLNPFRSWLMKEKFVEKMTMNVIDKLADEKRKKENISDDISVKIKRTQIDDVCKTTIVYRLAELLKTMWSQNATVTPKSFKHVVGQQCELFRGFSQNDSQELLNLVLDRVHEETKSEVVVSFKNIQPSVLQYVQVQKECTEKINNIELDITEREKFLTYLSEYRKNHIDDAIITEAYLYWKNYIRKSHSIITDLFTGLFFSKITCSECNTVTGSFEPFTILSVPTKEDGETTLDESISQFSKEEILTGDNQYHCNECKKKVNAVKRMYIWEPPNIMIIQLKRFKNDSWRTTKTSSKVVFPIDNLDIKQHLSDLHPVNNTEYDLWAISEHRGTCNYGHYVAYCKNGINNKWYEFNDDDIVHVPNDDLAKEVITKNAYILFYVRKIN
ncbi:peptidase C19 ubiquitin carboxyl-terminal hydrolase [Fadolivirus algeromassiliense]|jgi:ubiquitin C-terminal hydrolase|uniref:Peptidase C19 ubiquitin carboxyl-terminal hydrolase n=1 Tax=Fadolivirus FV1/VV64 TaxID=3070911 RepID=A0A7D3QVI5_9VIRU|nr:peptidase C19 ubiquitin carboxyl-terminal hydrolase [Fadolivirus algeromassiliense]QKF93826.1 peptidase C19 ubiquitin carboxyl-terminal hydrolase [Fadolivirus FV1/VV64]